MNWYFTKIGRTLLRKAKSHKFIKPNTSWNDSNSNHNSINRFMKTTNTCMFCSKGQLLLKVCTSFIVFHLKINLILGKIKIYFETASFLILLYERVSNTQNRRNFSILTISFCSNENHIKFFFFFNGNGIVL